MKTKVINKCIERLHEAELGYKKTKNIYYVIDILEGEIENNIRRKKKEIT